jgi:hypothetical protein
LTIINLILKYNLAFERKISVWRPKPILRIVLKILVLSKFVFEANSRDDKEAGTNSKRWLAALGRKPAEDLPHKRHAFSWMVSS